MYECQKKAFDYAAESTKLLITLSTGIITITITFLGDLTSDFAELVTWPLFVSWILFFLSIILGVATMLSLTGTLLPKNKKLTNLEEHEKNLSINDRNITFKSFAQIVTFLFALFFTGVFGVLSL
ncbi:hypothetical protein OU798_02185 [Prolixibacteraceae bacterium Z1-6]|uniref:Uncharacterized protein n=1 Tax=Draconibacterium aestuarii TaxID=2998507 RepID=A0A9X3F2F6_9BACT|nr:hypothetical protein [Prolixibacteraceae bacterium Z1-6]